MAEIRKGEIQILNLLRQVFLREPEIELLREFGNLDTQSEEGIPSGPGLMVDSAKNNAHRLQEWREDLAVEFARLFIGPAHPPAMPFASYYLSESRTLMTEETLGVRRKYLEAGLAVKDLHRIPDDHIGVELDFLYYLTTHALELSENGKDKEAERLQSIRRDFLRDHFALWAPLFANRVIESTQEEFYRGAASLLIEVADFFEASS